MDFFNSLLAVQRSGEYGRGDVHTNTIEYYFSTSRERRKVFTSTAQRSIGIGVLVCLISDIKNRVTGVSANNKCAYVALNVVTVKRMNHEETSAFAQQH